jgi:hypothetical protein
MDEPQVEVIFIDASTREPFGQAVLPANRLPDTFEVSTTLTISGQDWSVISAEPARAEDFIRTGKLVLTLSKISMMDPQDILYTLPTICDAIPALTPGTDRRDKQVFEIHEDDWQQVEFVSRSHQDAIDAQLAAIKRIYDEASSKSGDFLTFKNIALRSALTAPISSEIPLAQLLSRFPASTLYDGVSYPKEIGLVDGGFAFRLAGLTVYGQAIAGFVQTLALHAGPGAIEGIPELMSVLAGIMSRYDLYLVDWCTMTVLAPEAAAIQDYLQAHQHTRLLPRTLR